MNRSVLLIPVLCGGRQESAIDQALKEASHIDLNQWEEDNIPYTMRKKRHPLFTSKSSLHFIFKEIAWSEIALAISKTR